MNASFSKNIPGLLVAAILSVALATPAFAQKEERKTKQTVAMSQSVFEKLQEIQAFVEAEDYASGHALIQELMEKDKLSPYEKAQMHNLSGYSYYLQEQRRWKAR